MGLCGILLLKIFFFSGIEDMGQRGEPPNAPLRNPLRRRLIFDDPAKLKENVERGYYEDRDGVVVIL